jgi:hypothetical protein
MQGQGRAGRVDLAEFDRILAKAGSEPPRQGDEAQDDGAPR